MAPKPKPKPAPKALTPKAAAAAAILNATKQKKALFIDAYRKSLGNVSAACKAAGIDRGTYYNWIGKGATPCLDAAFVEQLSWTGEDTIDFAESQQLKLIQGYQVKADKVFMVETTSTVIEKGKPVIKTTKAPLIVPMVKEYGPNLGAIKNLLNSKGRARGYGKELEVKHTGQVAIKTIVIREATGPAAPAAAAE
jgi:hypothetical protein